MSASGLPRRASIDVLSFICASSLWARSETSVVSTTVFTYAARWRPCTKTFSVFVALFACTPCADTHLPARWLMPCCSPRAMHRLGAFGRDG